MLAGRSGKPCLTKFASFLWIVTIVILLTNLVIRNNAWPNGIPDAVYYSIAFVLGVKTFGDIKLNNPDPSVPAAPAPAAPAPVVPAIPAIPTPPVYPAPAAVPQPVPVPVPSPVGVIGPTIPLTQ